jgi:hypothetical protein
MGGLPLDGALIAVGSVAAAALIGWLRRDAVAGGGLRRARAGSQADGNAADLDAEARAEELLRTVVGEDGWQAYSALGFLYAFGPSEEDGQPGYGYLIYAHRPMVSFDARSGALLNELCVSFPDLDLSGLAPGPGGESGRRSARLPDADDVLAKWMALRADERGLINVANMHLPGRQLDPDHVRRDLVRLSEWTGRTSPMRAET